MKPDFCLKRDAPLAFYAWTDALILNAVKVKVTYFSDCQADLLILELPRISRDLVNHLEEAGIFQNVLWIKPPFDNVAPIRRKILKTFFVRQYRVCYFSQLQQASKSYGALFAGALWSETTMLFEYLRRYNPLLAIYIMEEGTANYRGIRAIARCDPLGARRDAIVRRTRYAGLYEQAAKAIAGMFLSCPEGCLEADGERIFPVSGYDSPVFCRLMAACTAGLALEEYRSRRVIFFLQPEYGPEWKCTLQILMAVIRSFGPENVVIRPHPDSGDRARRLKQELPCGIYWEAAAFPFEYVLYTTRWQDRILISRGSSCLFYPRYILGQEPTVIFTNWLYDGRKHEKKRDNVMPLLIERLKKTYTASERVFCPETMADFHQFLKGK